MLKERIAELVQSIAKTQSQPTYVIIDPKSETELSRFRGGAVGLGDQFVLFIEDAMERFAAR